jgi:phosphatidylinositol alpha-1,6-mannosyltransferase
MPREQERLPLLMLTELFLPTKGGTAMSFDDDFRRLGGKEVHVVTANVPGAEEFDRGHPNSVHRLELKRLPWLRPESLSMYGKLLSKAFALAARHRFAAIFAGRALPEGLVAWLVARVRGCPVLVYTHGEELTSWGRGMKFRAMRFVLKHADAVLANSDFTRDTLCSLIGVDPARIALIYPTVDESRFHPGLGSGDVRATIGLGSEQRLILSVGRLNRRKGFDSVIRALPTLLSQGVDAHYAVIGIGPDSEYLRTLAREIGVASRVHLLASISYEDLPRWYSACDVFAMPNRDIGGDTEGFGLVYLEAAACGKAALAGTAGGTGSAVVDGVTGLRVDGEQLGAVAQALARLLSDPQEAEKMGRRGRERVLENFTHERRVEQLRGLAVEARLRVGHAKVRASQSSIA